MSAQAWKIHRIHTRARELLEENPPRKPIPLGIIIRDVIATRREMNRIKRSRFR